MKVPYGWLKEFVPGAPDVKETARRLSAGGLEVASVKPFSTAITDVVVGVVISHAKHPNADKLSVCVVDSGGTRHSVVCGAPNVRSGMKAPFALAGAKLPNGMTIRPAKIRGVESQGMLCSPAELGLGGDVNGLLELPSGAVPGEPFVPEDKIEDWVLDIEVTPNRGDALSVLGVARQLAALLGTPWQIPWRADNAISPPDTHATTHVDTGERKIEIEDKDGCGLYTGRILEGVRLAPSPAWMQARLLACGLRPISNVVDITNYVLLELGHPLHAFDLKLLKGKTITVRRAKAGEKMKSLDGVDRELNPEVLVIADEAGAIALAGIMGGVGSEIGRKTGEILLEAAWFKPGRVRRGAGALGVASESSYRFERGVDPGGVHLASERACRLLEELAQARVVSSLPAARGELPERRPIEVEAARVSELLGVEIGADRLREFAGRMNCDLDGAGMSFTATPPSWRLDLNVPADLIEEFATLYGYENIPVTMPLKEAGVLPVSGEERVEDAVRRALTASGFAEAQTYSFMSQEDASFARAENPVRLLNPLNREHEFLRSSLIPGLLRSAAFNLNRGQEGVRLFEIGRVFFPGPGESALPREAVRIGIVCAGAEAKRAHNPERKLDIYDVKGAVERLLGDLGLTGEAGFGGRFPEVPGRIAVGEAAVTLDGKAVGAIGALQIEEYDLAAGTAFAELVLADGEEGPQEGTVRLLDVARLDPEARAPSPYPAVCRDIAIVIPESAPVEEYRKHLELAASTIPGVPLARLEAFDLYRGKQIAAGKKSVAFRIVFQSPDRTLTEAEVDAVMAKIMDVVVKAGGEVRKT